VAAGQVILITGCSSGIGRATAVEAARRGHRVFASARNLADLADLARPPSIDTLALDVTDPESIAAAVSRVAAAAGRIDALVNAAGYAHYGAVEEVSAEEWRAQFEVNFFGAVDVTRAVLPRMREARHGTIVMISSVGGRVVVPFAAPYCASKHALEAVSDSLRVEAAPFGIRVVVIEPGPVDTRFADKARAIVSPLIARPGPYRELYAGAERAMNGDFQRGGGPPDVVARAALDAIEAARPRTRYRVTAMARLLIPIRRFLPDRVVDAMMRRSLRLPKRI
jgi:NAD(P)-dependent dehydrogenase (short-subunit alcohol dehydrogenase family)